MTTYLELGGVSGDFATTPDHASLDITGDIDIRADIAPDDWTPTAVKSIVAKAWSGVAWSFQLGLRTNGALRLTWSANGSTTLGVDSTVTLASLANGERRAVRVTMDVDNGSSQRVLRYYTAPTMAGPWTQLGSTITTAGVTSIFASTLALEVRTRNGGTLEPFAGKVYAVQVRNGIDGTVVANPIFSAVYPGGSQFTDSAGRTWTFTGSDIVEDGVFEVGNTTALQAAAQEHWDLDLNGALRAATGLDLDKNGISHRLWGREIHAARNQALALLRGGGGAATPPP